MTIVRLGRNPARVPIDLVTDLQGGILGGLHLFGKDLQKGAVIEVADTHLLDSPSFDFSIMIEVEQLPERIGAALKEFEGWIGGRANGRHGVVLARSVHSTQWVTLKR